MRVREEILSRIKAREGTDLFGVEFTHYAYSLPYVDAQKLCKGELNEGDWKTVTDSTIKVDMIDYIEFAFEKARRKRGISAERSMNHFAAWLWLLGEDELSLQMDNYEDYGISNLKAVCAFLGVDDAGKSLQEGTQCTTEA